MTDQWINPASANAEFSTAGRLFFDYLIYAFQTDKLAMEEALEQLLGAVDEVGFLVV